MIIETRNRREKTDMNTAVTSDRTRRAVRCSAGPVPTDHRGLSIVCLGVAAGPAVRGAENGIATAVVVDDVYYMVDFGLGCTRVAHEAGLRGEKLKAGFITHLHSDHVAELPAFLLFNWGHPVKGFTSPVTFYGPGPDPAQRADGVELAGSRGLMNGIRDAFSYDIHIRVNDEGRPSLEHMLPVVEISVPEAGSSEIFPVHQDDLVTVTGVLVDHPPVAPALAYRFDTPYGSVTLSGDTAFCPALAALARDTDLLIHEAVNLEFYRNAGFDGAFLEHQRRSHSSPQEAGRIAALADAGHLVLSHLAGRADAAWWADHASETFAGPVTVATSGAVFRVADALDEENGAGRRG